MALQAIAPAHYDDPVRFWVPLEFVEQDALMKGGDAPEAWPAAYEIRGVVSSQAVDLDGEVIDQGGIDWRPFMAPNPMTGQPLAPLTWGHPNRGTNVIGRGKSIHAITMPDGTPATALIGTIMTGHPMGRDACVLHKSATRAGLTGLGLSIEGNATLRDQHNPKHIRKCTVWSVAVDPSPRNSQSLLDPYMHAISAMAKALMAGEIFDPANEAAKEVFNAFLKALPTREVDTARDRLLKGISLEEIRAIRILRQNPSLSFIEAMAFLASLKEGNQS